jgi:hypothetical protein
MLEGFTYFIANFRPKIYNDSIPTQERYHHRTSCPTGRTASHIAVSAGAAALRSHCAIKSARKWRRFGASVMNPSAVFVSVKTWPTLRPKSLNKEGGKNSTVLLPYLRNVISILSLQVKHCYAYLGMNLTITALFDIAGVFFESIADGYAYDHLVGEPFR